VLTHLRANLWLLFLTLLLCCVLYPLTLWAVGHAVFRSQADGSLVTKDGTTIGSRLIAQPFKGDEYFQPRPSNAGSGYDASASGPSNLGASNPLLRDRVARQLGTLAKYPDGKLVGDDVEKWFAEQPKGYAARWAKSYKASAKQWATDNTEAVAAWLGKEPQAIKDDPQAAADEFFEGYTERAESTEEKATWPTVETRTEDGKEIKRIKPAREGDDVKSYLFEPWLTDPVNKEKAATIVKVPADLVMASGSGLDPHITLDGALYQLDRVAAAWAKKTGAKEDTVRQQIEKLLRSKAESPLGGLAGVPLVNVLEVNQRLEAATNIAAQP
jgi:K+-transporting ATPase ATPase C chain